MLQKISSDRGGCTHTLCHKPARHVHTVKNRPRGRQWPWALCPRTWPAGLQACQHEVITTLSYLHCHLCCPNEALLDLLHVFLGHCLHKGVPRGQGVEVSAQVSTWVHTAGRLCPPAPPSDTMCYGTIACPSPKRSEQVQTLPLACSHPPSSSPRCTACGACAQQRGQGCGHWS